MTAWSTKDGAGVFQVFPTPTAMLDDSIPDRARGYLQQAIDSEATPSGSVMLCASAVDAMLKAKGYKVGTLYARIDRAVAEHVITDDMGKWAHNIRLDANDERHADSESTMPLQADARRCIDFAKALADLMFVLPSRVRRGLAETKAKRTSEA